MTPRPRILIVEDEAIVAEDVQWMLERLGYLVCGSVPSAEEALERLPEFSPDLALLDIGLKGRMDGTELGQKLAEEHDVPTVYVTAFADPEVLERAKATGPHGYVMKPFSERELHVAIEVALYRSRKERELAEFQEHLRAVAKLEAVGTLTRGICHEFNNIFAVVMGQAELLSMKLDDTSGGENAAAIVEAAGRGGKLTEQLAEFALQQGGDPGRLDLPPEIEAMRDDLSTALGGGVAAQLALRPGLSAVRMGSRHLKQILTSLASNASLAMPAGGVFSVAARNPVVRERDPAAPAGLAPGDYVLLSVSDTGCGMDEEVLPHIFEPFYTTRDIGQGTGLGLAIVHGIVSAHEGHVEATSEPGKGTTINIWLPAED